MAFLVGFVMGLAVGVVIGAGKRQQRSGNDAGPTKHS